MQTLTTDEGTALYAETVKDARKLAKRAKHHDVYCVISGDVGLDVRSSRAAILDALKDLDANTPCGGIFWVELNIFRLDRVS